MKGQERRASQGVEAQPQGHKGETPREEARAQPGFLRAEARHPAGRWKLPGS